VKTLDANVQLAEKKFSLAQFAEAKSRT